MNRRVTRLRFDVVLVDKKDVGDRSLFRVSDGIQDITRRSGMVWRIRFIYGKSNFRFRKKFGIFLEVSGKVLEGSNGSHKWAHELG